MIEIPSTIEGEGEGRRVRTPHVLRVEGARQSTLCRWGIGAVPVGSFGRQKHGGDLVGGPWAFLFQLCAVIDGRGPDTALDHDARAGDEVRVDGVVYRIVVDRFGYATLESA